MNNDMSRKEATEHTAKRNAAIRDVLDFQDTREFDCAQRGLIAAPDVLELTDEQGKIIWSQKAYDFVTEPHAPAHVNPSLWRHTQLNHYYGLFKVTDRIFQVRGYDMSNLTVIKGDSGWIIIDTLMSVECSKAAMQLVETHLGKRNIKAIIISHPHVDHFGGIKGLVTEAEIKENRIPIIVPQHFTKHAISENLYCGPAMKRRAGYQYGTMLSHDDKGALSIGIGMGQSKGTVSFILPTKEITETGTTLTIDGIEMIFQLTPGTEAPVEMNTFFPGLRALWMAENCTCTLHNLYTLRGAEIRNGNDWATYIQEAIEMFGRDTDVVFQSHNWPHWGKETIIPYMQNTAAVYKYIHDQTLFYINQGFTPDEISHRIKLPDELAKNWYTRPYYGTVEHNAKAVYQKYMGWYDANPVHLHPLTPTDRALKWMAYIDDVDRILTLAQKDFENGEYQWVAEITNLIVFADSNNEKARMLCADALEQLGYQAESGTWRNVYLSGALELRNGMSANKQNQTSSGNDVMAHVTGDLLLAYLGIIFDGERGAGLSAKFEFHFTDIDETYYVTIKNGVLFYHPKKQPEEADAILRMPRAAIFALLANKKDAVELQGDQILFNEFISYLTAFDSLFNIIEP